ncbi:UPAR/Ly6 domain-containing protein crim-like [Mytilus edulis]|uniref:Protein sleepless n=2 Tax=Mytilus galloprovincialis TaxID=29158 RepID=A0A8B6EGK1_MYTGA|nr:Hypothetical predicted protein [Mytilus galloprovincialis]
MKTNILLLITIILSLCYEGSAIMCHRCFSAMGGCGDDLVWWMFPWKDCGDSQFCVKITEQVGSETYITRECENVLMKSTRHRLRMPNLRRHGYCLPARNNDFWNPGSLTNPKIKYCFCNDWNGCNSANKITQKALPMTILCIALTFIFKRLL